MKPAILTAFNNKEGECGFPYHLNLITQAVRLPFDTVRTEYMRLKVFTDAGYLVHPKSFTAGDIVENKRKDGRIIKQIVSVTAQFIPLRKTLQTFFSLPNVYESVIQYVGKLEQDKDVLSNFIQGDYWQSKKRHFFQGKTVLPLFVFYDGVEVKNPLGSHKGIQIIGDTFIWIPCLPPEYQTLLENILLALLCHASDRKIYTNSKVFRILIEEINYLQRHRIQVETESGRKIRIYFALAGILGDNLGLNEVLGYVASFNANYFCCWCKTLKAITHTDCQERKETLRSVASYENDVLLGQEKTGIAEFSIWNEVENFHVYENCVADIMHDGPEGAFAYDMEHVTYHVIKKAEKKVNLEVLNDRILNFDYRKHGFFNRPPPISDIELKKKTLKMSASKMMTYVYSFPMLIGDLVSHDEVWFFYLTLRKITWCIMEE